MRDRGAMRVIARQAGMYFNAWKTWTFDDKFSNVLVGESLPYRDSVEALM